MLFRSTNTGVPPALITGDTVAMKVIAGTATRSPGCIPAAINAKNNASVAEPTAIACCVLMTLASCFSSAVTSGPCKTRPCENTSSHNVRIASLCSWNWRSSRKKGMFTGKTGGWVPLYWVVSKVFDVRGQPFF